MSGKKCSERTEKWDHFEMKMDPIDSLDYLETATPSADRSQKANRRPLVQQVIEVRLTLNLMARPCSWSMEWTGILRSTSLLAHGRSEDVDGIPFFL